jgi:hypothetical protein
MSTEYITTPECFNSPLGVSRRYYVEVAKPVIDPEIGETFTNFKRFDITTTAVNPLSALPKMEGYTVLSWWPAIGECQEF